MAVCFNTSLLLGALNGVGTATAVHSYSHPRAHYLAVVCGGP